MYTCKELTTKQLKRIHKHSEQWCYSRLLDDSFWEQVDPKGRHIIAWRFPQAGVHNEDLAGFKDTVGVRFGGSDPTRGTGVTQSTN